jgi:hypothetical protein
MQTFASVRTAPSANAVIDPVIDLAGEGTVNDTLLDTGLEAPFASVVITASV